MKKILTLFLALTISSYCNSQTEQDSAAYYDFASTFADDIRKFVEEIGGVDTSYLTPTRNDLFLLGRLPEIFDEQNGEEVFKIYQELCMDFFHIEFYPLAKDKVYDYYQSNLKNVSYDSIERRVNVREIDGNIYEIYDFMKGGKNIRTITLVYVKGLQLIGWEDIIWS